MFQVLWVWLDSIRISPRCSIIGLYVLSDDANSQWTYSLLVTTSPPNSLLGFPSSQGYRIPAAFWDHQCLAALVAFCATHWWCNLLCISRSPDPRWPKTLCYMIHTSLLCVLIRKLQSQGGHQLSFVYILHPWYVLIHCLLHLQKLAASSQTIVALGSAAGSSYMDSPLKLVSCSQHIVCVNLIILYHITSW